MKISAKKLHLGSILLIPFAIFLFSLFMPKVANAASPCIDIEATYEEALIKSEKATGVGGTHTYSSGSVTSATNIMHTGLEVFCTTCFCTGDKIMESEEISPSNKMGLVEMSNDKLKALMYNPPSVDVAEHMAQEWVPGYSDSTNSVFAGGYEELEEAGVVSIWNRTRNLAYVCFVVVMIVAGFMIMFRTKLGGQTLVTLGNFLPNVIIALVLVTFSFAIAGVIIDIGSMLCSFVITILYGNNSSFEPVFTNNPLDILWRNWLSTKEARQQVTIDAFRDPSSVDSVMQIVSFLTSFINPVPGAGVVGAVQKLAGIKVNLVTIIISGIMFVGAISVWIALLKSYLMILINVIIGPIQIMLSAIPGMKHMLTNWLKSLARNVLVFPMVLAMVNLPYALFGENVEFKGLPEGLTAPGGSVGTTIDSIMGDVVTTEMLVVNILKIVMLFMAAQAPKLAEAILPPDTPKALAEGLGKAKESFSKIPLIGGLFK